MSSSLAAARRIIQFTAAAGLTAMTWSAVSAADEPALPAGTQKADAATKGSTDVTKDQYQGMARPSEEESKDATELSVSVGALQSSGNSRLLAATAAEKFRLRRDDNQFRQALAGNYGRTAVPDGPWETNVQNVQGMARYDHFIGDVAPFLAVQERNDKFQGLVLRSQVDPGVGYYFLNRKSLLLWTELGYDFLYDIRRDDSLTVLDANGAPVLDASGKPVELDKTKTVHSGRLFVGYEHSLSSGAKLTAGVEYLQGLSDTAIYRLNSDVGVTANLWQSLGIAFTFGERYESKPLPGKKTLDTTTAVSLVYTLM